MRCHCMKNMNGHHVGRLTCKSCHQLIEAPFLLVCFVEGQSASSSIV